VTSPGGFTTTVVIVSLKPNLVGFVLSNPQHFRETTRDTGGHEAGVDPPWGLHGHGATVETWCLSTDRTIADSASIGYCLYGKNSTVDSMFRRIDRSKWPDRLNEQQQQQERGSHRRKKTTD
jgi:hypothetical protein